MDDKFKKEARARTARYREKKIQEIGKEAFKELEKNKKRRQRQKMKMNRKYYQNQLKRDRERKEKKKLESAELNDYVLIPEMDHAYSNKQSLSKGVKKAKSALPTGTPKKVAVLSSVLGSMTPKSKDKIFTQARRKIIPDRVGRPSFTELQQQWIIDYLKKPNITYTCPGRKESIYMGKNAEGVSQYHPKHYLLWFLTEIVPLMNEEIVGKLPPSEQFVVSYGSLRRFVKTIKYIRFRQDMPENTCTCDICENLELLLSAIKDCCPDIPTDGCKYIKEVLCDSLNEKCVNGICSECSDGSIFYKNVIECVEAQEEVMYYKWIHGEKYPEKVLKCGTGAEVAEELGAQTHTFRRHNYSRIRQHAELSHLKGSLPGTRNAVVQVDFSENYCNTQKDEIQSAYFGHENFTLYTVCVWYAEADEIKSKTYCIISDCLSHDKFLALHFNKLIIERIRQLVPNLEQVHFWSDGCASQFKSKYCFYFLATEYPSDIRLTWSFFESHHGKGPVDGVGGKVKSSVYSDVKAGKTVINNANQFAEYANKRVHATDVFFVGEKDIAMPELPKKVPDVPGTRRVHFVDRACTPSGKNKLTFFLQSKFCEPDKNLDVFTEKHYEIVDDGQLEMDDGQLEVDGGKGEDGGRMVVGSQGEEGGQNEGVDQEVKLDGLPWKIGEWVAVEYDGQLYPGEVTDIIGSNTQVNAMAKTGKLWKWPEMKDLVWYSRSMVKQKILPVLPISGSRDHYMCNDI